MNKWCSDCDIEFDGLREKRSQIHCPSCTDRRSALVVKLNAGYDLVSLQKQLKKEVRAAKREVRARSKG